MGYKNICYTLYEDPYLLTEVFGISNDFFKEAARRSVEAGCADGKREERKGVVEVRCLRPTGCYRTIHPLMLQYMPTDAANPKRTAR